MRRFALGLVSLLLLTGCGVAGPSDPVPISEEPTARSDAPAGASWRPSGTPTPLATTLESPWSVVPMGAGGALISERGTARVRELTSEGAVREVGVVPGVVPGGEAGLHGMAVLEDAGATWVYAYHGAADDNRVVRMPLVGDPGGLSLGPAEAIVTGIPRARNHDGGRIAFGPDGMLYIGTGDAGVPDRSQDPRSLGGKILRVTPGGEPASGNPFDNAVYSLGHRNVQGLAFTSEGQLWASEFGQNRWDELNRIEAGGNYGWPVVEGVAERDGFIDPVIQWQPSEASPSGIAAVGDTVFVAALRGERLWAVDVANAGGESSAAFLVGEHGRLRDVVAVGESLWLLTNNTDGRGDPRPEDDLLLQVDVTTQPRR
ncbi:PQQ-dependent sugar dehydrogenase [Microbacterium awajiense]|uniref:PQQ-dependent sugar dehydrogenase n=1 Tax=Microbacterium awajiense TaxID=415214 RepID=A0ABP7A784_9MICO